MYNHNVGWSRSLLWFLLPLLLSLLCSSLSSLWSSLQATDSVIVSRCFFLLVSEIVNLASFLQTWRGGSLWQVCTLSLGNKSKIRYWLDLIPTGGYWHCRCRHHFISSQTVGIKARCLLCKESCVRIAGIAASVPEVKAPPPEWRVTRDTQRVTATRGTCLLSSGRTSGRKMCNLQG